MLCVVWFTIYLCDLMNEQIVSAQIMSWGQYSVNICDYATHNHRPMGELNLVVK